MGVAKFNIKEEAKQNAVDQKACYISYLSNKNCNLKSYYQQ